MGSSDLATRARAAAEAARRAAERARKIADARAEQQRRDRETQLAQMASAAEAARLDLDAEWHGVAEEDGSEWAWTETDGTVRLHWWRDGRHGTGLDWFAVAVACSDPDHPDGGPYAIVRLKETTLAGLGTAIEEAEKVTACALCEYEAAEDARAQDAKQVKEYFRNQDRWAKQIGAAVEAWARDTVAGV